jgi:O-antigen biosynthesis protein
MNEEIRIAIYYDSRLGRNDGAPLYYMNVLRNQLKYKVFHLIPHGDTLKDVGPVDYHFWVDWGEDALNYPPFEIPEDGGIKIYVASDTHLGRRHRFETALKFDYAFFNQKRAVEEFKLYKPNEKKRCKFSWLPHAFEPLAYPNIETIKKYDICFIGHMQMDEPNYNGMSRMWALDRLFKEFPEFYYGSRHPAFPGKNLFEDAAHHFSESKIVFNISIKDDINMRVFETLGTGSFLLTNWLPTLGELFEDGVDLVTYKSYDEMIEKARYYLEHDKERIKIAESGYNKVINSHTYKNRIETIFKVIGG